MFQKIAEVLGKKSAGAKSSYDFSKLTFDQIEAREKLIREAESTGQNVEKMMRKAGSKPEFIREVRAYQEWINSPEEKRGSIDNATENTSGNVQSHFEGNGNMREIIFKMGILLLGISFIWVYWDSSQNRRYTNVVDEKDFIVFDNRTGNYYISDLEHEQVAIVDLKAATIKRMNVRRISELPDKNASK